MVQSPCQYVKAFRFGRASKISGYDEMSFFGKFGHFELKIGPLCFVNLTQNSWDYKTRAQELINGAICKLLSFFVKIWEHFKDGRVWGFFLPHEFGGQFWRFLQFLIYLRFGWTNLDEIGDQIEEFLMF